MSELPSDEISIAASGANPGRRGAAAQARRARTFMATSAPAAAPNSCRPRGRGPRSKAARRCLSALGCPRKASAVNPDYQVKRREAVKATLEWARDNEAKLPCPGSGDIG